VIYTLLDRRAFVPQAAAETAGGDGSGGGPSVTERESASAVPGAGFLPQPALGSPLESRTEP